MAGAAWVAHRPAELVPVEAPKPGARQRELVDDLKQAAIKRSALFEISEAEINRHLAKTLEGQLSPPAEQWGDFEGLQVKLEPDIAHATFSWIIKGHRQTATVDFRVERLEKTFRIEVIGGHYGHLKVPQGLLRPLTPAMEKLAIVLQEDIQALFQMNQIRIVQGRLLLDPRFP